MRRIIFLLLLTTVLLLIPGKAIAQTYKFSLDQEVVHVCLLICYSINGCGY